MTRLNVLLFLAVMFTGLAVVHVQYDSRRLVTEIERGRQEAHRLEIEWDRLAAERRAQATPQRVERVARERLGMHNVSPAMTQYIRIDAQGQAQAVNAGAATQGGKP
jgi:cell division protein FtsL